VAPALVAASSAIPASSLMLGSAVIGALYELRGETRASVAWRPFGRRLLAAIPAIAADVDADLMNSRRV
jgi:hypothetical protein